MTDDWCVECKQFTFEEFSLALSFSPFNIHYRILAMQIPNWSWIQSMWTLEDSWHFGLGWSVETMYFIPARNRNYFIIAFVSLSTQAFGIFCAQKRTANKQNNNRTNEKNYAILIWNCSSGRDFVLASAHDAICAAFKGLNEWNQQKKNTSE